MHVRIWAVQASGGLLAHFLAVEGEGELLKVGEGLDGGEGFAVFVEGEGAGGDLAEGVDEHVKTSGGAIQDREFFAAGGGGDPFEVAGGEDEVCAQVPDRFLNLLGHLREALHLFDGQTMFGVELGPVAPAQLVEGDFLHPPPGKFQAQGGESVEVVPHQHGVDPQFEIGGLAGQALDVGFYVFKQPCFAAHEIVEFGKAIHAEGQFRVTPPDVGADFWVVKLRAVGGGAEGEGILRVQGLGEGEQITLEKRFPAQPANQDRFSRRRGVLPHNFRERSQVFGGDGVARDGKPFIVRAKGAGQITEGGDFNYDNFVEHDTRGFPTRMNPKCVTLRGFP